MAKNVMISVNKGERVFTGRLIGFIDDEECRAILNTEGAARKISTGESVDPTSTRTVYRKRFVVVTTDYSESGPKEVQP